MTAEVAVALVQVIVGKQLGWIVRPQLQADKGIDAHIEVVQDGKATGRLVALQIKGGGYWFGEPTADGFVFRPKAKHVEYWLAHSLPVAVVLVDVDHEIAHWQIVTSETVISTGKGWRMTIPKANTFSMPAVSELVAASKGATYTMTLRPAELTPPSLEYLPDDDGRSVEEWIDEMSGSASLLLTALDESGAVVARYWADVEHPTAQGRDFLVRARGTIDEDLDAERDVAPSQDTPSLEDPHPPVRLAAARSIGKLTAQTPDALPAQLARHVARSNGMYLPSALLGGLSIDSPPLNDTSEELAIQLQDHPSARVRHQAGLLIHT